MLHYNVTSTKTSSPFALVAPALVEQGYTPLPICPGAKAPGVYVGKFTTDEAFTYRADAFARQRGRPPAYGEPIIKPITDWQTLTAAHYAEGGTHHESFKAWLRSPLTGVGVLLGNGLVVVDVDFTDSRMTYAVAAVLDSLPGVAVRRVGKKGFAAFMRLAEGCFPPAALHVKGQKVEFLTTGKQAVLPPSLHPDTGNPYIWITDDTLEDTPLDKLPVLTNEVLAAIRVALRSFGDVSDKAATKPRREHQADNDNSSAGLVERVNSHALANLAAWVPALGLYGCQAKRDGFVAVAHWRASSTGRPLSKRKQNLSITPQGIKDFGSDEGFTPVGLVMQANVLDFDDALGWLIDRMGGSDGIGLPSLPDWSAAPAPAKTAQDASGRASRAREAPTHRVTLDAAGEVLERQSDEFWTQHVNQQMNIAGAPPDLNLEDLPAQLFKVEAGAGKTKWFAIDRVVEAVARGLKVIIAAPEHSLCAEIVEALKSAEVYAAVWQGIERRGQCLRPKDLAACTAAGLSPKTTICGQYVRGKNGGAVYKVTCPLAGQCGAMAQRALRPDVWVVTHASLLSARNALFTDSAEVDVLVIDESMVSAAIPAEKKVKNGLDLDALRVNGVWPSPPDHVAETWNRISTALAASLGERGDDRVRHPVKRSALITARVEIEALQAVVDWHQSELNTTTPRLRLVGAAFQEEAKRLAPIRRELRDRLDLLVEIQNILADEECDLSGRVVIRTKGNRAYVHTTPLKTIHPSWRAGAAIAILDATAPAPAILEHIVRRKVELAGEVAVEWSDDIEVVQVINAPVRSYQVRCPDGGKTTRAHNAIVEMAKLKAIQTRGRAVDDRVLFVPRKMTTDIVWPAAQREAGNRPPGLPSNMEIETTGRITGKNNWKDVAGCVITASADAGVRGFERMAGVLTGRMPERMMLSENKNYNFASWLTDDEIREIDGQLFNTATARHPNEIVQQLHTHIVRGQFEQVAARLRPVRRDGKPGFIWIFTDWSLDIPVGRMVDWADVDLGYAAHMLATRGVFSNGAACWAAYGGSEEFPLAEAGAAWWTSSELSKLFRPDERSLWWSGVVDWRPGLGISDGLTPRLVRFDYQVAGSKHRDTLWFAEGSIKDPAAHVAGIVGAGVVWMVDGVEKMRQQDIIWTSPALAYAATSLTPKSHLGIPIIDSLLENPNVISVSGAAADACRMSLKTPPPSCPTTSPTPKTDEGIPIENLLLENPHPFSVSWVSADACRMSLKTSPPTCPAGWQTFTIRLARSSKAVEVFTAPHLTADDTVARAAALGFTIKEINRA